MKLRLIILFAIVVSQSFIFNINSYSRNVPESDRRFLRSFYGDLKEFEEALEAVIDPNFRYGDSKDTPLMILVRQEEDSVPDKAIKIKLLLDAGADVNLKNSESESALDIALSKELALKIKLLLREAQNKEIIDLLKKRAK